MIFANLLLSQEIWERFIEIELAVLIGQPLKQANEDRVDRAIAGFGIGLDLTCVIYKVN